MVELLIVMGLIAVLVGGVTLYLQRNRGGISLDSTVDELVTLLRSAQQKALSQEGGTRWGVYVDNVDPTKAGFSLFAVNESELADTNFSGLPGTSEQRIALATSLSFSQPAAGQTLAIVFNKGTGLPATPASIILATGSTQQTISVEANGRVTY